MGLVTKYVVTASWEEAPHLSPEAQAALIGSYLPHELDARTKGKPALGAGAIYPVPESEIVVAPFVLPAYWRHNYAIDVGWNRTAVLWGAHDTQTDVLYLYSEHYRGQAEPAIHAQAIRARGEWIPGVIDPAARGRSQADCQQLMRLYADLGLKLIAADNSVDSGIFEVWTRLSTGRLKVFSTLRNWLAEYRIYRRDEKGHIVKENDHLMDDTRYMVLSGLPIAAFKPRAGLPANRHEIDYDPYAQSSPVLDAIMARSRAVR
jgi:hypothetical protein